MTLVRLVHPLELVVDRLFVMGIADVLHGSQDPRLVPEKLSDREIVKAKGHAEGDAQDEHDLAEWIHDQQGSLRALKISFRVNEKQPRDSTDQANCEDSCGAPKVLGGDDVEVSAVVPRNRSLCLCCDETN